MSAGASGASAAPVGVLALQGDVREHRALLEHLGAEVVEVRIPADLKDVGGLVFPGGESTTLGMLLDSSGLREPIAERLGEGMPALGTCAGMILLSREVLDGRRDQVPLGAIDITVRRNAFGRQLESFESTLEVRGLEGGSLHAVFIRAPVVEAVGPGVEVLAEVRPDPAAAARPVVCAQGAVLVAAFHPELTGEERLHRRFLDTVASSSS